MNIIEEYSARLQVEHPIVYHAESSLLILNSRDKERWGSSWCVLTSTWENVSSPGFYKIRLVSPRQDCLFDQNLLNLSNSHFCLERSWASYERFFYEWNPYGSGLFPVFGDRALVAAWEIFVSVKESWFARQTFSFRESLYNTLSPHTSIPERIAFIKHLQQFECFSQVRDLWNRGFLSPLNSNYISWFEKFGNYARHKLLRQK